MTPPKKPREFWLPLTTLVMNSDENRSNGIHVREVTEPDEKKSLRKQVEMLEEALKETNLFLVRQKVFDKSEGRHTHLLEFMWVTEALTRLNTMRSDGVK